jgi:transposase-like protein
MARKKRRNHSSEFKAKVALAALKGAGILERKEKYVR